MNRILALLMLLLVPGLVAAEPTHILIVVGPSNHPPGSHEVAAGGRLMKHCLENMANLKDVKVDVVTQWPKDVAVLDRASSVVFIGDTFPPMRLPDSKAIMAKLDKMMQRGCGIVCVHFATGLNKEDVAADGEHPLLHWMGGYFATRCVHHQSIAKIFPAAKITPAAEKHPVSRGWKEFTLHDEPYINNYFGKDENKLAPNVTALATSLLPPEAPKRETVAWCVERPDGGRGFGIVMPHFYRNWKTDDLRRFILNGIVWTAKLDVPADGVQTTLPDLDTFAPLPVKPAAPAEPKKAKAADALIQKDTVWSGAVVVTEEVRVRKAKLTIEPGTKVEFMQGGRIKLEGGSSLIAKGTADKPVRFVGDGSGAITGDNCTIVLERCQLEGLGVEKEPFLSVTPGTEGVTLRGCSISDCSGIALQLQGPFEMTGCDIRRPKRKLPGHATGFNAHGKGTKVTVADNTIEHMSVGGHHANADILIRGNVVVYGGFTGWGNSAEKMVFEDNYVHWPVQKGTFGLSAMRGVIRNNVIRGGGWTTGSLGGDISGNLIMSLPHEEAMKLPGGFDKNCTHEHIVGLLPKSTLTRNIFVGASYGAVMGIGRGTCSESIIRNNTFDLHERGYPVFLNHLPEGEVKGVVIRNNLMLRCGGIHSEDTKRENSVAYADYSLWAAAGRKDRFPGITIEGKQPGDAGFGKHDVPPAGDKNELKPDEVVVNLNIEFPFSDEDLLARTKTPAEVLKAYRAAYTPKANSVALDTGDPADKNDPEVKDGKPDIGAIEQVTK